MLYRVFQTHPQSDCHFSQSVLAADSMRDVGSLMTCERGLFSQSVKARPSLQSGSKCKKRCREVRRKLWVKQGAVKRVWLSRLARTTNNPKILSRAGLQNLSHVHTRKFACVARVECARCGVLFTFGVLHVPVL